jgi:ABC-type enterochelin transport system substrate-binding protein
MKKGIAFLAVAIIAVAVAYTSISWNSDQESADQANQEVPVEGGEVLQLTEQEASLSANPGEKKVVITDLGMF